MRTLAIVSQKGGVGKSMLARQLAVIAGETQPVILIDRDAKQGTTTKWWHRRQKLDPAPDTPTLLDLEGQQLPSVIAALKRKPGVTFIDTRPAVEEPEAEAARVSDLVLVPVGTSLDDLEAVGDTLKMVRRIGRRTVIIVNAAKNEARAKDTRAALAAYPFAVCPAHLTDRSAFLDATTEGRGVSEMQGAGARAAEAELRAVWKWILEQGEE